MCSNECVFQGQGSWGKAQVPWGVETVPSESVCPLIFWKVLEWGSCTGLPPPSGGGRRGPTWLPGVLCLWRVWLPRALLWADIHLLALFRLKPPAKLSFLPPSQWWSLGGEKSEEAGTRGGVARRGV